MRDSWPRREARHAIRTWDIGVETLEDVERPRHALLGCKAVRTAADDFAHRRKGRGRGKARRHDHRQIGGWLRQRFAQQRKWLREAEFDRLVSGRRQFRNDREQRATKSVALRPARQARDDIAAEHGRAIMEKQPSTQLEPPCQAIIANGVALDHLRPDVEIVVHAVKRVEHHLGMSARDIIRRQDGIEQGKIGIRHEAQHA